MKKILAFLLATLMISLSFASCESVVKPTSSNDDTETNALDTNAPESDTNAPESDTNAPESDTNAPEVDTNTPESDTNVPEVDTNAPEVDTNAPESDTNAPESETDAPQADEPPSILPVYSGTPDVSWYTGDKTEYTITTAEQLAGINQLRKNSEGSITFEGVTIKLGADIAINGGTMQEMITNGEANTPWVNVASTYLFKGTFDGQGHTVYGLYVKLSTAGVQGMFGALGGNATIKNLKLKNALVTGPKAADKTVLGTLASKISGDDASVTISNVEINSTVKENGYSINQVGGFIGAISDAGTLTMDNCIFRGSLTTSGRSAGGLVGSATNLKATVNLKNCKNYGNISCLVDAGGLIGTASLLNLTNEGSTNEGAVNAPSCAGALYGYKSEAVDQKNGLRPQSTTLRVMSFNILSDFDDYSTAGKDRITAVQQEIYFYSPDIIGVQEDYSEVLSSFSLDGYKKISPSSLSSGSSNCSIFYKSGITLKTSGSKYVTSDGTTNTVALTASDVISGKYKLTSSELSELGITSSTNMRTIKTSTGGSMLGPKRITWGVFEINGKTVIAVNVHLQHRAQNATYSTPAVQKLRLMERLKQLELTQKQITSLKNIYPTAEVVIMGDFNDLVGTDTYLYLRDTYQYSSAHETAVLKYGVSGTWNNAFSSDTQGAVGLTTLAKDRSSASMLDFCFVSSGIKTLKFRVGAGLASVGAKEKVYTSDHLPIVADLYIGSSVPASLTAPPSVYSGTPDTSWYKEGTTSYTLTTADQLMGINELRDSSSGEITFEGVTIKLGADMIINQGSLEEIIARGSANKPWKAVNSAYNFKGTFDGQGHSISGVYLSATNSNRGMFGGVVGNATIKNFVLENSYFCGSTTENKSSFGCIVALINDSSANVKLTDITVSDSVKMQETTYAMKFIGGFVGKVESGTLTMTNCHFNGTIDFANSTYATAFVGMTNSATLILNNCHGDGYVKCYNYIAGLSGYTDNTTKTNNDSCFTGTLKATKATDTNSNASFIK